MPPPDLADSLVQAIKDNRDQINAEAEPFVGRVPFRVDLDCNIAMHSIRISVHAAPARPLAKP